MVASGQSGPASNTQAAAAAAAAAAAGAPSTDEIPLIEVAEAARVANDAFNRVKAQKIAEQALTANRAEEAAQYEGLGSEILGKAMKQRERERSNRAAAAASRARVLTYQQELENRLNRLEAERNAFRKEVVALRARIESTTAAAAAGSPAACRLAKLQGWVKRLEMEDPELVKGIVGQGEIESLLREEGPDIGMQVGVTVGGTDGTSVEPASKRRRV